MTAKDLKNALLQEAVQGKLVPQIASEGNARDLLEEVRKERGESLPLASARKRSSATPSAGSNAARNARFAPITEDEIPFDIPESWCWCRLGEVTEIARGGSPRPIKDYLTTDESGYNWIKIGDTDKNGKYINQTAEKIVKEGLSKTRLVHKGDFLLTNSMSFGRPYILNIDGCIHDGWLVISPKGTVFNKDFLYYVLSSTFAYNQFCDSVSGAVVKNLNSDKVRESLLPLPPLAEQKRIVAAIEKFMPLIEEYDKKETQLKAINEKIGTLTKKAILQEAVQGKLVPQNTDEGNAKDLLEEIKKEKAKLIKEGKIKKEKPLPEISEDEIPFDIPENWCWCRVGDLFSTMSGLGYKKDVLSEKSSKMIRVLRGGNILDTSYVFKEDDILISDKYVKSELFLRKNYLITPAVTSLEHIGKIGYIEKDYDDTVVGGFVLMLLPHFSDEVLSKYCLYLFGTRWFRDMCKEITHKSGQAFYNLSRDKLLNLVIPVPPLAEQKRIIVAIKKMLQLCEKLGE